MTNRSLPFLFTCFLIFCITCSFAQFNTGIQATGGVPVVKTVNEVIAAQYKTRKIRQRRDNEEDEIKPVRKMNPLSPAVSVFDAYKKGQQSNIVSSGSNLNIHNNFLAGYIGDNGTAYYPPDCNGDISTASQILTTVNGRLKAYNVPRITSLALTTTTNSSSTPLSSPIFNLDIDALFTNAGLGINRITDPHVRFDRLSGRWFIIAIDKNNTAQNYLTIAVSNTTVLSGGTVFTIYYLQGSTGSSNASTDWMDYPTLGIDKYALYVGANIFDKATHTINRGSSLYLINKASLIAGSLAFTVWQYGTGAGQSGSNGVTGVGMLTPQGVQNDDPGATEGYFIATDWATFGSMILKRISNPGGVPSLSADMVLTVPTTTEPIPQPALGTPGNINTLDDRLYAAMIMKNKISGNVSLWTAHNIEANAAGVGVGGGGRNATRWYEIGTLSTTPTLIQSGTVFDNATTNPVGYYFASIATNGQGHTLLGSSVSATNRRVQAAYTSRYKNDVPGSMQQYDTATTITSAYNPGGGLQRWGDYSQTVVDPSDNMTLWTFQEYTTNTNQWGLRAIQVSAPPPAQAPVASAANFCGTDVLVTLNGAATNNAGFFDPGSDAGGPGYNRLAITCSGSIPVSNINFISATQVTCKLNTTGKANGSYTLTITNPDGQFVTTSFTLTGCNVLPLTLLQFSGKKEGYKHVLNWRTTNETGVHAYVVERSLDGNNFLPLGTVKANNTAGSHGYTLADNLPIPGINYYRLKPVDRDGKFSYSNILILRNEQESGFITTIYPNPVSKLLNVEMSSKTSQTIFMELTDYTGKKLLVNTLTVLQGINQHQISLEHLPAGIYILQVMDAEFTLLKSFKIVKE